MAPVGKEARLLFTASSCRICYGIVQQCSSSTLDDERFSDLLIDYLSRFSSTGGPNGGGAPVWQPYSATNTHVQLLDVNSRVNQ